MSAIIGRALLIAIRTARVSGVAKRRRMYQELDFLSISRYDFHCIQITRNERFYKNKLLQWYMLILFMIFSTALNAESLSVRKRTVNPITPTSQVVVICDKKKVYAHEPVIMTVRFLYDKQSYIPQSLVHPACIGGQIRSIELMAQRDESVKESDGTVVVYGVSEWRVLIWAGQSGTLIVEPFQVIAESMQRTRSFFGFSLNATNTFFSPSTLLEITPLPSGPSPAQPLIGVVKSIELACDTVTLSAGQACTLTCHVNGLTNASALAHPELKVPEGFKIYPSTIHEHKSGVIYEYALHAMVPGRFVIESQNMSYFDTDRECFVPLTINSLSLYVMQGANITAPSIQKASSLERDSDDYDEESEQRPVVPRIRRIEISMPLFLFFSLLLVIIVIIRLHSARMSTWLVNWYRYVRIRRMLIRLRRECVSHTSPQDIELFYQRFKDLHHVINFGKTMGSRQEEWHLLWKNLETQRFGMDNECGSMDECMKQVIALIDYLETVPLCLE